MRIQVLAVNSDLPLFCELLTVTVMWLTQSLQKAFFSPFIVVNQIHSQRKHTCVRYTCQMKRYHDLTQRWALYRKPLSTAHDIFIECRPLGRVFAPFWSKNGYTLCPFWSGIGYGFWGNYGIVWTSLSFQFQMSTKERKISEFEMDLKNFFVCALI